MMVYLGVAVAGGLGAVLRYAVGRVCLQVGLLGFPYATLLVNALGSFLIGFLVFAMQDKWGVSEQLKTIVVTGLLGGFTTFSAFSLETVTIVENGEFAKASVYVLTTLILCLVSCVLGLLLAKNLS